VAVERRDALDGHLVAQDRVVGLVVGDHPDVRRVALVARARVSDLAQRDRLHVDQAQTGESASQRLKRSSSWEAASRLRVSSQSFAQAAGSLRTDSGWAALRATKPGKAGRPVGCPIGW